jgi:hypothetical protein
MKSPLLSKTNTTQNMKKLFLLAILLPFALYQTATASVTINFGMGEMYSSSNTSAPFANGGLINILAKTDGLGWGDATDIFSNLTSSFVPAGAVLVASFASNNSDGPGTVATAFTYSYSGAFAVGQPLILVAYSDLTTSSTQPGSGTTGFFFRTNSIIDGSDIAWFAPSDGSTVSLGAYTVNLGGSVSNNQFTSGSAAPSGSGFTTVPEPSTYALLALGVLAVGGYSIRNYRKKTR